MQYVWIAWGWIWSRKLFFAVMLTSAVLFFVWIFPFSDLSQIVTTQVANASGNQVYVQTEELNLHFIPTPSISAKGLSIETALPALEAKWAKFTPGLFSILFNIGTMSKAGTDPAAMQSLLTSLSFSLDAEDILGADVDFSMGPGKKSESGKERSRVSLAMENLNLARVKDWADLPVNFSGHADFETDILVTPDFQEQPDGDYVLKISKFNLPASVVTTPMGPLNLPTLTLANVTLKGRMTNGQLIIEEGSFGQGGDPIQGRIKGQVSIRLQSMGGNIIPILGGYNLTVDMSATTAIQKEMMIAFILFEPAKTNTATGFRYLFRAQGSGMEAVPSITRLGSF